MAGGAARNEEEEHERPLLLSEEEEEEEEEAYSSYHSYHRHHHHHEGSQQQQQQQHHHQKQQHEAGGQPGSTSAAAAAAVEEEEEEDGSSRSCSFSWGRLWRFMGPGFVMSIGYVDPGNIESDVVAGAQAGYALLWLLLAATGAGLLLQLLAARLGCCGGDCGGDSGGGSLAAVCRRRYPAPTALLLWLLAEAAVIGAGMQEVIGTAIAFRILSNGVIPLWLGVLLAGVFGFLFLFLESFGVRKLEALFGLLILVMGLTFAGIFQKAKPDARAMLTGLLIPRLPKSAVDKAVGIVGSIIMPHNLFLHSALVHSRRAMTTMMIDTRRTKKKAQVEEALRYYSIESALAILVTLLINVFITSVFAKAVNGTPAAATIGLGNASDLLQKSIDQQQTHGSSGSGSSNIKYVWAVGLLAAGQSSSMSSTYAGQLLMAGFLNLRIPKCLRALLTRSVAILPTMLVALAFRDDADNNEQLDLLNHWLNVLQSLQLPFALIPLLTFVDDKSIMGCFRPGVALRVAAAIIALSILAINFYLLALSLLTTAMRSLLLLMLLSTAALLYATFIAYLVSWRFNLFWFQRRPRLMLHKNKVSCASDAAQAATATTSASPLLQP